MYKAIVLLAFLSMEVEARASYIFITGPLYILAQCDYIPENVEQSIRNLTIELAKKDFSCVEGKEIEGAKILVCRDSKKNDFFVGSAFEERQCLLGLNGLIRKAIESGMNMPKFKQPISP